MKRGDAAGQPCGVALYGSPLELAKRDLLDLVGIALGQDKARACAGRQDVLIEILQVDSPPDVARHRFGFGIIERGIFLEI